MRSRKRLAWCFALLLPIGRPVAAQVRPAAPPRAADLSSPPPDIQAIIKKLLGGAGPTPDEAKRFNEYDQTHHEVIVRSMNALRDSLMRKAAAPVPTSPTATVTLSGAQTGTLQGPVAASFESAKNASGFGFETQAGTSSVQVTLKIVGTLKAGTYTSTSAAISGAVQV